MRIEEYYTQKFGIDAMQNQPLQSTAAGSSANFLDALKDCSKTPQAAQVAAETSAGQTTAAPPLEAGNAPVRVVDVEAEFGLTLTNGMSPEAIEKQTQLLERLDKLCADNPGVYYRLNPAIFQKMADDPDFEKTIYEAVNAFEKATVEALASSNRAVSAMYMGANGDYAILTGRRPEDDMEDEEALWDVIITRMREAAASREELQETFPGMPENMTGLVWEHLLEESGQVA